MKWLETFLDWQIPVKFRGRGFSLPIPPVICLLSTFAVFVFFVQFVQLKPEIGTNFFFSSDDPQMQEDKLIQRLFPQDPQLVLSVRGNMESEKYLERIERLSDDLEDLEQVISVQSLSHGPGSLAKAKEGPLWSRILISKDGQSSLLAVFIQDINPEQFIPRIEAVVQKNEQEDFEILVSGEPYIVELLRRGLYKDLKVFSIAALGVFGLFFIFFFRSGRILAGTLLTCAIASMSTLIITQILSIDTGPLTANLSTIVFVLTLSHLIFILFNWRDVLRRKQNGASHPALMAMKWTLQGSFWSMLTTLIGFLSLLFVKATPLKQLGVSGAIGTLVAFAAAYLLFPLFLYEKKAKVKKLKHEAHERKIEPFFYRRHATFFVLLALIAAAVSTGILRLNTDPSLLDYFQKGGDLRNGLEYIDENGGSSPLFMVVHDPAGEVFNEKSGYEKLWNATQALEEDVEVGSAVSLPVIVAQAEMNIIAKILAMEWLIDLLESERFGRVAKFFVTEDRSKALIMMRMRETGRTGARVDVIDRLEDAVEQTGLWPFLTGGVYSLQGRMSRLVKSSLVSGILMLLGLFVLMGGLLSRNARIAGSMFFSLAMIPGFILGVLGLLNIPLDVISAPAVNIALGMSVDAMIHMLIYVRRNFPGEVTAWESWREASLRFWRPILYAAVIIGAGFGIFALSDFPPTQRFGIMVVAGAVMAPCAALISLVTLVTFKLHPKKREAQPAEKVKEPVG